MKKREQFDVARRIAEIRRLQLERARADTLRLVQALDHRRQHEHTISASLDAHLEAWRDALRSPAGLSPSLATNWSGAVASVRNACQQARQDTQDAATQVEQQRVAMTRREQQSEHAGEMADRAWRRFQREREEQQASRIEDMFLANGDHS